MSFLLPLLMFVLILICLVLGLLILIQLPKKEAGMGQAFGGGVAGDLFGPGTGNALTKLTKYAAGAFIIMCVLLAWLTARHSRSFTEGVSRELNAGGAAPVTAPAIPGLPSSGLTNPAAVPAPAPAPVVPLTPAP